MIYSISEITKNLWNFITRKKKHKNADGIEMPFYVAFFQGPDLIINEKVDIMKSVPDDPHGFIVLIWIKYKEFEWLINLEDQYIKYKNGSEKFTKEEKFKLDWEDRQKEGHQHIRYIINIPPAHIKAISKNRAIRIDFTSDFYKKYRTFDKCIGALISKQKLRYLSKLHEILI